MSLSQSNDDRSKVQILSSVQILPSVRMHPPNTEEPTVPRRKALRRTAAKAPPNKVPLHNGSDIYISTKDLVNIYTPKPALYTARLADVIFGRDTLMNACVNRTANTADLVPLEQDKLRSVIVHVVHVFKKQNIEISEPLVLGYLRNRLCYLQSSKKY